MSPAFQHSREYSPLFSRESGIGVALELDQEGINNLRPESFNSLDTPAALGTAAFLRTASSLVSADAHPEGKIIFHGF
jgi:hypothetical protein